MQKEGKKVVASSSFSIDTARKTALIAYNKDIQ